MEFVKPTIEYAQLVAAVRGLRRRLPRRPGRGLPAALRALRRADDARVPAASRSRSSAPSWWRAGSTALGDGVARGNLACEGALALDGPTVFLWGLILLFGIGGVLLFAERHLEGGVSAFAGQAAALPGTEAERQASTSGLDHTEVYPLMLFAVGGMMMFPAANDLLTMFVALEVLSLPLYLLCGLARRRRLLSQEAALKYFLLGAFSSGFFLYGVALVFGYAGSMEFAAIDEAIRNDLGNRTLLLVGMGMLAVGLLFKVGAAPFQAWTPDVYQGAPTAVTAFMAAAHQGRGVRRDAAAVLRRLRGRPLDLAADDVGRRDPHHARRLGAGHRADRRQADAGLLLGRPHRLPAHRCARRPGLDRPGDRAAHLAAGRAVLPRHLRLRDHGRVRRGHAGARLRGRGRPTSRGGPGSARSRRWSRASSPSSCSRWPASR